MAPATQPDAVEVATLIYFQQKGLTANQAAGIVGNLKQESSLNPSAAGGFLAQWLGARLRGLEAFAAGKHVNVAGNTQVQLDYIWQELNSSEKGTLTALRKTKTPQEAARVFSQGFERPSQPNLAAREKYAVEARKGVKVGRGIVDEGEEKLEQIGKSVLPEVGKVVLTGILLLAGAVLVVYGIMVAVRPRESAFSLPRMPMPVPV